jgi:molybdopterin converting factor small subunit
MRIGVRYWSWFRDIAGTNRDEYTVVSGARLDDLLAQVHLRHPRLEEARKSTLVAVGLEYQPLSHPLREGDEVSLFPPVQGGFPYFLPCSANSS